MTIFNEIGSSGLEASGQSKIYYKKGTHRTHTGYGIGMNDENFLKQIEITRTAKPTIHGRLKNTTPISLQITKTATYCNVSDRCSSGVLPPIVKRWQGQYMP